MSPDHDVHFDFRALEFFSTLHRARDTFLLNFGSYFGHFEMQSNLLHECWAEFGRTRDGQGQSHVGLLLLSQIVQRHVVLGFQSLLSYQSFLTWLTFRPGLEAFLFIGKWVDDPNPWFAYREQSSGPGYMSIQYLETDPVLHEAHLLSFLNLVDRLYVASCALRQQVLGRPFTPQGPRFAAQVAERAESLASGNSDAKAILEDLGLWQLKAGAVLPDGPRG